MKFIELAIVAHNKHAFVKNNPNFLFADKTLNLPSLNQIQAMLLGNNTPVEVCKSKGGMVTRNILYWRNNYGSLHYPVIIITYLTF